LAADESFPGLEALIAQNDSSGEPDRVIDFDQITRDPTDPRKLRSDVDSGDHQHPGEQGYRIMGDTIDLSIFE
jgi:hypothetical protein